VTTSATLASNTASQVVAAFVPGSSGYYLVNGMAAIGGTGNASCWIEAVGPTGLQLSPTPRARDYLNGTGRTETLATTGDLLVIPGSTIELRCTTSGAGSELLWDAAVTATRLTTIEGLAAPTARRIAHRFSPRAIARKYGGK
jgi:hypothetical protein